MNEIPFLQDEDDHKFYLINQSINQIDQYYKYIYYIHQVKERRRYTLNKKKSKRQNPDLNLKRKKKLCLNKCVTYFTSCFFSKSKKKYT